MPYCLLGIVAVSLPSPIVPDWLMLEIGELRSSSRCVKDGELPELNVMSSTGSLMKLTPPLSSWAPRVQVKSSRNWYLCCSVVCGVFPLWPTNQPPGNVSDGSVEFSAMWLRKYEYWNMNSLSRPLPSTELRFTLAEWNVLRLSPHDSGGDCGL